MNYQEELLNINSANIRHLLKVVNESSTLRDKLVHVEEKVEKHLLDYPQNRNLKDLLEGFLDNLAKMIEVTKDESEDQFIERTLAKIERIRDIDYDLPKNVKKEWVEQNVIKLNFRG